MTFFNQLQSSTEQERQVLFSAPIIEHALRGDIQKEQYVSFLTQAYHHVKHTVPLLMACGSRLGSQHEWLRTAIAEYIEEELGHEEWILSDIAACGGDAEKVRHSRPHISTEMMVAYAYHQIDRGNPIGFFGMETTISLLIILPTLNPKNTSAVLKACVKVIFSALIANGFLSSPKSVLPV